MSLSRLGLSFFSRFFAILFLSDPHQLSIYPYHYRNRYPRSDTRMTLPYVPTLCVYEYLMTFRD